MSCPRSESWTFWFKHPKIVFQIHSKPYYVIDSFRMWELELINYMWSSLHSYDQNT